MTEKFDKFKIALEALIREHKVELFVSVNDTVVVYDLDSEAGFALDLEDMTKGPGVAEPPKPSAAIFGTYIDDSR